MPSSYRDQVMFLGFPTVTDSKDFCTMMRDILFGKKSDEDFIKAFDGVHEAALKARSEIGAMPGDENASFEYIGGKVRAIKGEAKSQWISTVKS